MVDDSTQKVTVSLPEDALHYADSYKKAHGMNRSEVLVLALKALRERELAEGYKALAAEQAEMLTDADRREVLEQLEW